MKVVKNYLKNATKSMVYAATDVVTTDLMPNVGEFADSNKSFLKATYATLKNPSAAIKKQVTAIQQSKVYQAIDYGARNAVEDLRTGNFYNREREERDLAKLGGLDVEGWDDLSEFGIDSDWENNLGKPSKEEKEITAGDVQIVNAIDSASGAATATTVNALIATSNSQIKSSRADTAMLYAQNERLFGGLHKDLGMVNATMEGLFNLTKTFMENMDKNSSNFYTQETKLSTERNAILKEMLEMQRNQYKTASQKEAEARAKRKNNRIGWGDISTAEGMVDFEAWGQAIAKNVKNELSGMNMQGFSEDGNMMAAMVVSPFKDLTTALVRSVIPATVKAATKELNDTISGIFGNVIGRLGNARNRSDSGEGGGLLGMVAKIFGINTNERMGVDTSRYEHGAVPFDGETRKAIKDVIPAYLRRIEAALTGKQEQVFDYASGRWTTMAAAAKRIKNIKPSAIKSTMQPIHTELKKYIDKIKFTSKEDQESMYRGLDQFDAFLYENNMEFYPDKTAEENGINSLNYPDLNRNYNIIRAAFANVQTKQVGPNGKTKTTPNVGTRMKMAGRILSSKQSITNQFQQIEANGGYLGEYYAANGQFDKHGKYEKKGDDEYYKFNAANKLNEMTDKYGNTVYDYLFNINRELVWQRESWDVGGGGAGSGRRSRRRSDGTNEPIDINSLNAKITNSKKLNQAQSDLTRRTAENKRVFDQAVADLRSGKGYIDFRDFDIDSEGALEAFRATIQEELTDEYASMVNDYINENIVTKNANSLFYKQGMLDRKDFKEAQEKAEKSRQEEEGNVLDEKETSFISQIVKKLSSGSNVAGAITGASAEAVTNLLYTADLAIYEMFFKADIKDSNGEEYNGFMDMITKKTEKAFKDIGNRLKEDMIDPFLERFGIDDDFKDRFKGTLSDIGKGAWHTFVDANKAVYGPAVHDIAANFGTDKMKKAEQTRRAGARTDIMGTIGKLQDLDFGSEEFASVMKSTGLKFEDYDDKDSAVNDILLRLRERLYKETGNDFISRDMAREIAQYLVTKPDEMRKVALSNGFELRGSTKDEIAENFVEDFMANMAPVSGITGERRRNLAEPTKVLGKEISPEIHKREMQGASINFSDMANFAKANNFSGSFEERAEIVISMGASREEVNQALAADTDERKTDLLNKLYHKYATNARGTMKPFTGKTMLSKNELVFNAKGTSLVPETGLYDLDTPSHILNSEDSYDLLTSLGADKNALGVKSTVQQDLGRETLAAKNIAKHAGGTMNIKNNGSETDIEPYLNEAKKYIPEMSAGGIVGGAVSMMLGLVGGPLVGAAVGAATSLVTKSDTFKDVIFGKEIDGQRSGGLISKTVMDTVKKYAPDAMKYGLAGIIPGLLTPLGPLGGLMVGAGIGILKNNENFTNKYFGEGGALHIGSKEKSIIEKMVPGAAKGAAAGAVATLFGGPFGILGNAAIGSAIGIMVTSDEFKDGVLGKVVDGERIGGLVGELKEAFKPMTEAVKGLADSLIETFENNIVDPLSRFATPFIHELPHIAAVIPSTIAKHLSDSPALQSMESKLMDLVNGPLSGIVKSATKTVDTVTKVATTPFRALGWAGDKMRTNQITSGRADYMTARERVGFMNRTGQSNKISKFDEALMTIGSDATNAMSVDDAEVLMKDLLDVSTTEDEAQSRYVSSVRKVDKLLSNYGIDKKSKDQIRSALENGGAEGAAQATRLLNGVRKNGKGLSDEERQELLSGGLEEALNKAGTSYETYDRVRQLNSSDKNETMKKVQDQFASLGVTLSNNPYERKKQMQQMASYLNTEITDRKANGQVKLSDVDEEKIKRLVDPLNEIKTSIDNLKEALTNEKEEKTDDAKASAENVKEAVDNAEEENKKESEKRAAAVYGDDIVNKKEEEKKPDEGTTPAGVNMADIKPETPNAEGPASIPTPAEGGDHSSEENDEGNTESNTEDIKNTAAYQNATRANTTGINANIARNHYNPMDKKNGYNRILNKPNKNVKIYKKNKKFISLDEYNAADGQNMKLIKIIKRAKINIDNDALALLGSYENDDIANGNIKSFFKDNNFKTIFRGYTLTADDIKFMINSNDTDLRTFRNHCRIIAHSGEKWSTDGKWTNLESIIKGDNIETKINATRINGIDVTRKREKEQEAARAAAVQPTEETNSEESNEEENTDDIPKNALGSLVSWIPGIGPILGLGVNAISGLVGSVAKGAAGLAKGAVKTVGKGVTGVLNGIGGFVGGAAKKIGGAAADAINMATGGALIDAAGDLKDKYVQINNRFAKIRKGTDGSVELDTADSNTKLVQNELDENQKKQNEANEAAVKQSQLIEDALDTSDVEGSNNGKLSWWKLLLGGAIFVKSGLFSKLYEGVIKPGITKIVTWFTEEGGIQKIATGIGNVLGSVFGFVKNIATDVVSGIKYVIFGNSTDGGEDGLWPGIGKAIKNWWDTYKIDEVIGGVATDIKEGISYLWKGSDDPDSNWKGFNYMIFGEENDPNDGLVGNVKKFLFGSSDDKEDGLVGKIKVALFGKSGDPDSNGFLGGIWNQATKWWNTTNDTGTTNGDMITTAIANGIETVIRKIFNKNDNSTEEKSETVEVIDEETGEVTSYTTSGFSTEDDLSNKDSGAAIISDAWDDSFTSGGLSQILGFRSEDTKTSKKIYDNIQIELMTDGNTKIANALTKGLKIAKKETGNNIFIVSDFFGNYQQYPLVLSRYVILRENGAPTYMLPGLELTDELVFINYLRGIVLDGEWPEKYRKTIQGDWDPDDTDAEDDGYTTVTTSDGDTAIVLESSGTTSTRSNGGHSSSANGKYGKGVLNKLGLKSGRGYVKQIDPSVANIPFNISSDTEYQTIGDSACGPAAAVNAVKAAYGRGSEELVSASNYALEGGYKEVNGGTMPQYFTDYFNDNGLGSTTTYNTNEIANNIRSGAPTVLMGVDPNGVSSSTPYGSSPHYVTATGTDSQGRVIVQDPESQYDNQLYSMSDLMSKTQLGVSAFGKHHFGRGLLNKITSFGKGKWGRGVTKIIFVGDSRTVGMESAAGSNSHVWIDRTGGGYSFFSSSDTQNKITNAIDSNSAIVILMGVNDMFNPDTYKKYASLINSKTSAWMNAGAVVYYVSVNPVSDSGYTTRYGSITNSAIESWNTYIKAALNTDVKYIDTYNSLKGSISFASDGLHYQPSTYKDIYDKICAVVLNGDTSTVSSSATTTSTTSSTDTSTTTSTPTIFSELSDMFLDSKIGQVYKAMTGVTSTSLSSNSSNEESSNTTTTSASGKHRSAKGRGKWGRGYEGNIWYALRQAGATEEGAAGMMGNLEAESGMVPNNLQDSCANRLGTTDEQYTADVDSGTYTNFVNDSCGYGLAQWTSSNRKQELKNLADSNNASISDIGVQTTHLINELQSSYTSTWNAMQGNSISTASNTVLHKFESPRDQSYSVEQKRLANAQKWYNKYKGTEGDPISGVTSNTSTGTSDSTDSSSSSSTTLFDEITNMFYDSPLGQIWNSFLGLNSSSVSSTTTTDDSSPSSSTGSGDAASMVSIAKEEVGTAENPLGSNNVKYNDWYYGSNVSGSAYPWCAAFVSWVANQAGVDTSIIPKDAYTVTMRQKILSNGGTSVNASDTQPGDIVFFSSSGQPSGISHVGIITDNSNGVVSTVEGNSSNKVNARTYDVSNSKLIPVRPKYANTSSTTSTSSSSSSSNILSSLLSSTKKDNSKTETTNTAVDDYSYSNTRGGNTKKPISKYGQFKNSISGLGKKTKFKSKEGYETIEDSDTNIELGRRMKSADRKHIYYGKGSSDNTASNYNAFLKAIIEILTTIATNTDKLNEIVNYLNSQGANLTTQDVTSSTSSSSSTSKNSNLKSKLSDIFNSVNATNSTSKLSNTADNISDSSLTTIINAVNALASE